MNDREKLIELLQQTTYIKNYLNGAGEIVMSIERHYLDESDAEDVADHLIANGVVVLPCKVGETVYVLRDANKPELIETTIEKIVVKNKGYYMKLLCNFMYETSCNSIGKTVFYSKEEALAKMKEA